jgi:hypothetical protein
LEIKEADMARGGRKYPLLLYRHLLGRWWPPLFTLGLVLILFVGILWGAEWYFLNPAENPFVTLPTPHGIIFLVLGGAAIGFSLFLLSVRNFAYVQLFGDHFRIVTPFLRLKISYKRIHSIKSSEFSAVFPPNKLSSWQREMIGPMLGRTANIVHLKKSPMARFWLRFFLSPFFFYDKTPHFVFLVDDWMMFSVELDSARVSGRIQQKQKPKTQLTPGLLNDLNKRL